MKRLIGYWCPSMPDGPLIPPHAFTDPCGSDVAVYEDGSHRMLYRVGRALSSGGPSLIFERSPQAKPSVGGTDV